MSNKRVKLSILITPINILIDLLIINSVVYTLFNNFKVDFLLFSYLNVLWLFISYNTKFYRVFRYTHFSRIITLLFTQFFIFILAFFAFNTFFKKGEILDEQITAIYLILLLISLTKITYTVLLKKYRLKGLNYKNVVVFGDNKSAQNVINLFNRRQDLGYKFFGFFSDEKNKSEKYLGPIKAFKTYAIDHNIEEVYCESNAIEKSTLVKIRSFCNEKNIDFNLIPENKGVFSKKFKLEYYGTIPILKRQKLPFERIETHITKRIFDIIFSLLVCICILPWVFLILYPIIYIDSKGPLFFKQLRDGANGKQFICYKLRSMRHNAESDKKGAQKNDPRVTRVGAFLRKTSLDELPQFINVLFGDMSVIGPRPHMKVQTKKYLNEIDNYIIRNSVKPGITGLAQVSGYRGEIQKKSDIENRVRLDIFYIENWSLLLDLKIVLKTVLNVFKGEDKAY